MASKLEIGSLLLLMSSTTEKEKTGLFVHIGDKAFQKNYVSHHGNIKKQDKIYQITNIFQVLAWIMQVEHQIDTSSF